jgi:DNA-binding MarR family transcriptional regulator
MEAMTTRGAMTLVWRLVGLLNRRSRDLVPGLNVKRFVVLSYLEDHGSMSQQALGDVACIDPNNLVILLNELEESGYVERRRDPADRRRHFVAITPEGRRAFERAERELGRLESEILGALTPDERLTLRELLGKAVGAGEPAAPRRS